MSETVGYLLRGFPRQTADRAQYERELADVPAQVLVKAVRSILRQPGEWLPTVGDVRARCVELMLDLPSEREAARQVDARIQWARSGRGGECPSVHPLVREAVAHVGGWHTLKSSDRPEVVRGQMLRFYREARQAEIRERSADDLDGFTPA